jgi:glycine/D-amino acid oxidase-like deaminating enzyme
MTHVDRRRFLAGAAAATVALQGRHAFAASPKHVIVIGAGIIGASIAYHLAKRGASVTIIDRTGPAAGATRNSMAWLTSYQKGPQAYAQLAEDGINGWRRLQAEIGSDLKIQWGGAVFWVSSDAGAQTLRAEVLNEQRWGRSTRLIAPEEISQLVPAAKPGPVSAAAFSDAQGGLDPVAATQVLLARAQKMGAKLLCPCELVSIERRDGVIESITTTKGKMVADSYVLATGVDTMPLAQTVDVPVPLVEATGVLAHSKPLPPILNRIIVLPDFRGAGIKQNPDGRIVTGGHFASRGDDVLKNDRDTGVRMLARAAQYVPQLAHAELDFMTLGHGIRSKDDLPIVGFNAGCANLYVAAMDIGVTLAPVVGQLASIEVLQGVTTSVLAPFRASRFNAAA